MHIQILNGCLILAWLLVTAGGLLLNVGAGLLVSGLVLIGMAIYLSRTFGVYAPQNPKTELRGEA
jgi:hypothetical protein